MTLILIGSMDIEGDLNVKIRQAEELGHKVTIEGDTNGLWASVRVYAEAEVTPPHDCSCGTATLPQPSRQYCVMCEEG